MTTSLTKQQNNSVKRVHGIPFKPGQSGNPKGRPLKGFSLTETIKEMIHARPEIKQALGTKILDQALKGDFPSQKLIWNYMDGLPVMPIDQKIEGSFDLTHIFVPPKDKGN